MLKYAVEYYLIKDKRDIALSIMQRNNILKESFINN
jgi:hypothetical protein